jgi:hypothetical protein
LTLPLPWQVVAMVKLNRIYPAPERSAVTRYIWGVCVSISSWFRVHRGVARSHPPSSPGSEYKPLDTNSTFKKFVTKELKGRSEHMINLACVVNLQIKVRSCRVNCNYEILASASSSASPSTTSQPPTKTTHTLKR